jgi:hypothetical protein
LRHQIAGETGGIFDWEDPDTIVFDAVQERREAGTAFDRVRTA